MRSVDGLESGVWSVVLCALSVGCGGAQDRTPDDPPTGGESAVSPGRAVTPTMEFTEQAAIALPTDQLLNGAALSPSGNQVVAWFAERVDPRDLRF